MHTVLITGAGGGLAASFARILSQRGVSLVLCSSSLSRAEALAAQLPGAPLCLQADLTKPEDRSALFDQLADRRITLDGLINVAGTDFEGAFTERTSQQIATLLRVNMEGTVDVTHRALHQREVDAPFTLLFIASLAAYQPMPGKALYAASKRFLLHFGLAIAEELRGSNVGVTVVCPAGIPTSPYWEASIASQGFFGRFTARTPDFVAAGSLKAAARNKCVYIPGWINVVISRLGALVPTSHSMRYVMRRWDKAARRARQESGEPPRADD